MLALPPAILEIVDFQVNTEVGITVQNGCLVIAGRKLRLYALQDLLLQCDPAAPLPSGDRDWLDMPPVGSELP